MAEEIKEPLEKEEVKQAEKKKGPLLGSRKLLVIARNTLPSLALSCVLGSSFGLVAFLPSLTSSCRPHLVSQSRSLIQPSSLLFLQGCSLPLASRQQRRMAMVHLRVLLLDLSPKQIFKNSSLPLPKQRPRRRFVLNKPRLRLLVFRQKKRVMVSHL